MLKSKVGSSLAASSLIIFTMPMAVGPFRAATVAVPKSAVSTSEVSLTAEEAELSSWEEVLSVPEAAPSVWEDTLLSEAVSLLEEPVWPEQPNRVRHRAKASARDKTRFICGSSPFSTRKFSKLPGGQPPAAGAFLTAVQLGLYNLPGKKARALP